MGNCLVRPKATGEDARPVDLEGVIEGVNIEYDKPASADYEVKRKLGSGMQGSVYLAISKSETSKEVAIKETHIGGLRRKVVRAEAYAELETLNRMRHPNVVRLIAAYQTNTELQLVLELVDGKNILAYLVECDKRVREDPNCEPDVGEEKFELMRQLVDAVAHVHARGVVFRDLQPDNVLVTNSSDTGKSSKRQIKLIDFGRACKLERQSRLNSEAMGTTIFQAPEVETKKAYGQPADMWAVGVFLYLIIGGSMPFERSVEGYYQVLRGAYTPFSDAFSPSARDLVSKLLKTDPSARINAPQAKQHRFLRLSERASLEASRGHKTRASAFRTAESNVMSARELHVQAETDQQVVLDSLETFVVHGQFEEEVTQILAHALAPDDVETLRAWLSMSAETSVQAGTIWNFDTSDDDTTHHGQLAVQILKQGSSVALSSLGERDVTAPAPVVLSQQFSSTQRSVLGLAHEKGVCSFDELVLACLSCGQPVCASKLAVAGAAFLERRSGGDGALALDEAQKQLCEKLRGRTTRLRLPAGAIPSMLFRWTDILSRAESSYFEIMSSFVRSGSSSSLPEPVPSLPEDSLGGGLAHASSYGMLRDLDRTSSRESSVRAGHQFLEPGGSNRSGRGEIKAALAMKAKVERAVVRSGSTGSLSELVPSLHDEDSLRVSSFDRKSAARIRHQFQEPGGSNRSGRSGIAAALALKAKQRAVVRSGSTGSLSELVPISHEGSLQGSSLQGLPAGKLEGSWRELGFAPVGSNRSAHRSVRGGGAVARTLMAQQRLGMPPLAAFAPASSLRPLRPLPSW